MWKLLIMTVLVIGLWGGGLVQALTIQVDYTYDSNGFFSASGNPEGEEGAKLARAALEAAAARWSAIIDQPLAEVRLRDDNDDPRIGFTHPGTGSIYQISPAKSSATDSLATTARANEYRGEWVIDADVWILFVGAYDLSPFTATGGTRSGKNWNEILYDPAGVNNRGFNVKGTQAAPSLPVWGGSLSFNNGSTVNWHFDHSSAPPEDMADLYSIALHEIGHALGLNGGYWYDWLVQVDSRNRFVGAHAVAAFNADNVAKEVNLPLEKSAGHWPDGAYQSFIFPAGSPNYTGTVGSGALQDLLMDPRLTHGKRIEITNVDVGALRDLGWSVISGEVVAPVPVDDLKIALTVDRSVELSWGSQAGASYTVQTSIDCKSWSDVTPAISASKAITIWRDGDAQFDDPNPPALEVGRKHYRIVSH